MVTTIQISEELQSKLTNRKIFNKETYEEVIWDLLEDSLELSEETKKHIEISRKEISEGKTVTLAQVKKKMGL
jgi:hypothetical protein